MALTFSIRRVLHINAVDGLTAAPGVIALTDGSYVYGYCTDFSDPTTHWYRSTDNGETWTTMTSTGESRHNRPNRGTNCKTGLVIYPQQGNDFDIVTLSRSVDGGATWTTPHSWQWSGSNPFRSMVAGGAILVNRSRVILAGQFEGDVSQPRLAFSRSDDGGLTWTDYGAHLSASNGSYGTALGNLGGGRLVAATVFNPSLPVTVHFLLSTDYGLNWTDLGAPPMVANTSFAEVWAFTPVTDQIVIASGFGNQFPDTNLPYVWRSTNAGSSWSLIPAANIASYPAAGSDTRCWEVKRLTSNAVVLGVSCSDLVANPPWRLSLDQGATFPTIPTVTSGSISNREQALGSIVTAQNGNILMPSHSPNGASSTYSIWVGNITC